MTFFQDSTVTDLVQSEIEKVSSLEDSQAKRLLKALKGVRGELMDRLLTIPEGTFSEQQLNVTLVQVEAAIAALNRILKDEMVDSSEILARQGISDLVREINRFDRKFLGATQPLNIDAILRATEAQNFLVNKYEASIDAYSADLRSQITTNIMQSMIMRDTTDRTVARMVADIGRFFVGEEWKLTRIVRTELHSVYNLTKMDGMLEVRDETLPDLMKTLIHPMDARTGEDSKALAEENPIIPIDEPFVQKWNGRVRTYQSPPDRPNDRAILVPYRRSWGANKTAFVPRGTEV